MSGEDAATAAAAAFLAELQPADVPAEVERTAASVLLDSVACAAAGTGVPAGQRLLSPYGADGAGWIADPDRPVRDVAAANAQAANVLDFDTTYRNIGHPGSIAACAALGVGARLGASGEAVLTATVAGYELAARIGAALQPSETRRAAVWPWGSWHVFASAGATAVLLDFDREACRETVNVASGTAPVSMVNRILEPPSTILKNAHLWAARSGVEAAHLAADGITGYPSALDGPDGFHAAAGSDRWRPADLVDRLADNERWAVDDVSFKPYPICRWTHTCVDAAYRLRERGVAAGDVETIRVLTVPQLAEPIHDSIPSTHAEATWSVQWGIGCALTGVPPGAQWYEQDRFDDRQMRSLMESVEVRADEEYSREFPAAIPATLMVETGDGSESATVRHPSGSPEAPISPADRREKATGLLEFAGVTDVDATIDRLSDLASVDDVSTLVAALSGSQAA